VLTDGSVVTRRRQGVVGEHRWGPEEALGKKSGGGAHRGGRATVGRQEVVGVAALNGGGVTPVVVDEGGWVLELERDPGVRRWRPIEGKSSSEGAHRRGVNGGDSRTESGVEEGLRWWKTGEEDAWAMGMNVRR
jgi:hypothetical protein